jgi:hypothetical protein
MKIELIENYWHLDSKRRATTLHYKREGNNGINKLYLKLKIVTFKYALGKYLYKEMVELNSRCAQVIEKKPRLKKPPNLWVSKGALQTQYVSVVP